MDNDKKITLTEFIEKIKDDDAMQEKLSGLIQFVTATIAAGAASVVGHEMGSLFIKLLDMRLPSLMILYLFEECDGEAELIINSIADELGVDIEEVRALAISSRIFDNRIN